MKIAVTTASGQLGSAIVRELADAIGKENTIGIARTPSKAEHLGVEVRRGDYNERSTFETALRGIDSVLVVSAHGDPSLRIQMHRNIIDAAKISGVRRIVYTSISGTTGNSAFSPVVESNRATEQDLRNSGLEWVIGRNGIYIEPDLEYIEHYVAAGAIANCAGEGRCGYTSRRELARAYARLLTSSDFNGEVVELLGAPVTQGELVEAINEGFGTQLVFKSMSVEEYRAERVAELGDFMGTVIAGIYEGIRHGNNQEPSDFETIVGRPHQSLREMIGEFGGAIIEGPTTGLVHGRG